MFEVPESAGPEGFRGTRRSETIYKEGIVMIYYKTKFFWK